MGALIAVARGDGIGPEIIEQALRVLQAAAPGLEYVEVKIGGAAIDKYGSPLPDGSLAVCCQADAVLLGAVGAPRYDTLPKDKRPEQGILKLRREMGLYANLRPAKVFRQLAASSPLRNAGDVDMTIVRELTGGIYFGTHETAVINGERRAEDVMAYSESEIARIARIAFKTARRSVVSVDKANVLDCSRLWREVVTKVGGEYPGIELTHMYVDNAAMQLVRDPARFDVLLTENMFGDILSDEASMIVGSIGVMPSASLGATSKGLYEPIHGSAPDIAGLDKANPIGAILSAAMLLRHSLGMTAAAGKIEAAVDAALTAGLRTADIMEAGGRLASCTEMGDEIVARILE
ncbi:MAG TPA: 3-isopropylmalate dehydrogenase [Terriglobales bacterium]|nr:3-isopropylmalate dehydrogenase [Terriglobales bacterium]